MGTFLFVRRCKYAAKNVAERQLLHKSSRDFHNCINHLETRIYTLRSMNSIDPNFPILKVGDTGSAGSDAKNTFSSFRAA